MKLAPVRVFSCKHSLSDKRTLKLYVIGTLVISARCVKYLIVTLVRCAHYIVLHCYLSDKRRLCFVFFVTLIISALFICIVTLAIKHAVFVFDCYVSEKSTLYL